MLFDLLLNIVSKMKNVGEQKTFMLPLHRWHFSHIVLKFIVSNESVLSQYFDCTLL